MILEQSFYLMKNTVLLFNSFYCKFSNMSSTHWELKYGVSQTLETKTLIISLGCNNRLNTCIYVSGWKGRVHLPGAWSCPSVSCDSTVFLVEQRAVLHSPQRRALFTGFPVPWVQPDPMSVGWPLQLGQGLV